MRIQWLRTGHVLIAGLAATAAAWAAVPAGNVRATVGYDGPNAINLAFAYQGEAGYSASSNYAKGIKDAPNYTSGPAAYGVDSSNTGQTWNMMVPGSAAYGGLGALSGGTYFNASAAYTKAGLVDAMGNATGVSFTTPVGANFQSATWPSPEVAMNNEYVYSPTPRGGAAPVAAPIEDVIGGLTPGARYVLYLYGSGTNNNNMGTTFSLDSSNAVSGMPTTASTTGSPTRAGPIDLPWEANSLDYNYANASPAATKGITWISLTAQANGNGDINIYSTNLAGQNQSAFNGFQIQPVATSTPEPASLAIAAAAVGLCLLRRRIARGPAMV